MRQILIELCAILREQKAVLRNMLELSKEERQILVAGESDKLEDVIRLEFKEMNKLGAIEKRRMELHKRIATEMGITDKDITVTSIAEKADKDERDEIRKIQEELTEIINEHSTVNRENRELVKTHIEYSQMMLDLLVEVDDPLNNIYGGDGKETADKRTMPGLFDGHG